MAYVNPNPPYPPATNPGFDSEVTYNNQAHQPNTPDDFLKPPPYSPQSLSQSLPEAAGCYPQQYPQQPPMTCTPPPGYYSPQFSQQVPMMYVPPEGQQTTTVVVGASTLAPPVVVQRVPYASYCGMVVFACLVFWFCNALFGLIAFILAVVAENTKTSDAKGAQKLGKASMWLSIFGIIVTVVFIAIAVGLSVSTTTKAISMISKSESTQKISNYVTRSSCCSTSGSTVSGPRQVISKYISPTDCCRNNGYIYYRGVCILSAYDYSTFSLARTCCRRSEYYYDSSPSFGYCYYYWYD